MYRVFIEYKDGSHKEQAVNTAAEADALKSTWESEGEWKYSEWVLLGGAQ